MERLILCGGGHVSLALAQIGALLDFEVVVLDDRSEFASRERFPMAREIYCMPFDRGLEAAGHTERDFFAILTRGHAYDKECLARILRGPWAYVGMIGSRAKVAAVMAALEAEGFSQEELSRVHSPIGLKLGGQTPAEIAVSIAAELVAERARLGAEPAPPPAERGVLLTITKKSGSAPRGPGAWMLVRPDGTAAGTIGGGAVEHQAKLDALELWNTGGGERRRTYDLSPTAAALGMVCGGKIEVEFEVRR